MPEVFGILDDLVADGKLRFYGVSVERVEEALRAARHPNVQSIQIIFNMFRLKPAEELFPVVREKRIGILARVPLASGLLSGKLRRDSTFEPRDHRSYNRHGESFDAGETFSGVDYDTGLEAVEALRAIVPPDATMAQLALRWILMFPEVSAAIPGAKNVQQTEDNARAADLPPLTQAQMDTVREIYDRSIRPLVHHRW
jgi:aryl-alcohol dehydrogenase-like predicted oxidoreductase